MMRWVKSAIYILACGLSCAVLFAAQDTGKKGFVLLQPATETAENVSVQQLPAVRDTATPAGQGDFIDTYASQYEIKRLRQVIQGQRQEIGTLKQELGKAQRKSEQLRQTVLLQQQESNRYEVKKGDSLWKIAGRREIYNNSRLWIKIFNANMDRIKDPNRIYPGQLFEIPK